MTLEYEQIEACSDFPKVQPLSGRPLEKFLTT